MRSRFGVGITPPNVLETPKPVSSVMIKSTLGAPSGGTMRGGQYGVDCAALRSILPPNFGGSGGSWLPSIVVVAAGEPGTPVVCWPNAGTKVSTATVRAANANVIVFMISSSPRYVSRMECSAKRCAADPEPPHG